MSDGDGDGDGAGVGGSVSDCGSVRDREDGSRRPPRVPLSFPMQPPMPVYGGPPKRGLSTGVIVLIVMGIFGVLILVPFAIGIVVGFRRAMKAAATPVDPRSVALSQSYKTTNGLLTAHYPADFAAKRLDDATLMVTRNLADGTDEVVTFGAVPDPITDDPHEFGRILLESLSKNVTTKGGTTQKGPERAAKCLGSYPGVEVEMTFTMAAGHPYDSKSCFFMIGKRGYELRYDVPRSHAAQDVPLLERMMDSAELAP